MIDATRIEVAAPAAGVSAGALLRVLSLETVEAMQALGAPLEAVTELAARHERLWALEDAARAPDATMEIKRAIDRENAARHQIVDRLSACFEARAAGNGSGDRRSYSETPAELIDRLIIVDLKIRASARCQADAGLPDEARRLCAEKSQGLRAWRAHLEVHLREVLDDVRAGRALLPPRSEFKMYNDPQLNPALRHGAAGPLRAGSPERRPTRRETTSIRHILGIACTGHGASLAYMGPDGVMRASVLDRWARGKNMLMFAREEAGAIVGRVSELDASIHDALAYTYGRFPAYREFEADFPAWFGSLTRGLDVGLADVDLVVTSDSHFATCSARLGRSLDRWLPRARVVTEPEHHHIHQCQAFWASGLPEAAVVTLDTCGEDLDRLGRRKIAGTISRMDRSGRRRVLREFLFPETSVGILYALVNHHVGFREGEEGKTMGLAPYGDPDLYARLRPALHLHDDGAFDFVEPRELNRLLGLYAPSRRPREEILPRHMNVAYAGQRLLEDIVRNTLGAALRLAGVDDVAYSGGVALNSVANEAARRAVGPRRMYVPPNPGDAGHALGCALLGACEIAGWAPPEAELPDYLGPGYTGDEVEAAARSSRHEIARVEDPDRLVARCIAGGHVVARYEGRAEFGPRALGNRSILCDPRRPDMKDYLNASVKMREAFRPFAPSVLREHVADWFELDGPSPFMLRVVPVRREKAHLVPAIVHVDGSARVQTVDPRDNPGFWSLIRAFGELTSVPLVLNTSFNVDGQPIVETPADAVACFESTRIDVLVMGPWILSKRPVEELASRPR